MSNKKDSLGDRMKGYENISRIYLTKRLQADDFKNLRSGRGVATETNQRR